MKRVYPVIFTRANNVVLIEVPDLGILSEAQNIQRAIELARDAIGLKGISMEDAGEEIPKSTEVYKIEVSEGTFAKDGDSFVSLVDIDFGDYRKKVDNKGYTQKCYAA